MLKRYQEKMEESGLLKKVMPNGLSFEQYTTRGTRTSSIVGATEATINDSINVHVLQEMGRQKELAIIEEEHELERLKHEMSETIAEYQGLKDRLIKNEVGVFTPNEINRFLQNCDVSLKIAREFPTAQNIKSLLEDLKSKIVKMNKIDTTQNELAKYQDLKKEFASLKIYSTDKEMKIFLDKYDHTIEQAKELPMDCDVAVLREQISKMEQVRNDLKSSENREVEAAIKELINKFDSERGFWNIGKVGKAQKIKDAFMKVPIEERAKLLQSEHPSVTALLKAIAEHRISIFTKTTNEKGQIVASKAANSFRDFKEKFKTQLVNRKDVMLEQDDANKSGIKH